MSIRDAWYGIKQRCNNPNYRQWKDYGGRGIAVRFASFDEFFADVGERPPGMTIDRIDNDGHYEPGNVRWATRAEQQRNRRNAVFVEIEGTKHRAMDLAKQSGHKTDVIVERVKRGLSLAEVLSPENSRGDAAKKRARTHCKYGHEFTPENTRIRSDSGRDCRACHNAKMRRLNARKRRK